MRNRLRVFRVYGTAADIISLAQRTTRRAIPHRLGHTRLTIIVAAVAIFTLGSAAGALEYCGFTQVSAGGAHTCGLKPGGKVVCWGDDSYGQASAPAGVVFKKVSAGGKHTCASTPDDRVLCWGDNTFGQSSPPEGNWWLELSAGGAHTCALDTMMRGAICWGNDADGQSSWPVDLDGFHQMSAGDRHNCGVKPDGTLQCWGSNSNGQSSPPEGDWWFEVSAGGTHSCALDTMGAAHCWGNDADGQSSPPALMYGQVSAGGSHTCGLAQVLGGTSITCWGNNDSGQSTAPSGMFSNVSAGGEHTCALRPDGKVECWGNNEFGQSTPPPCCGDGNADEGEQCDNGAATYEPGDFCRPDCALVPCGCPAHPDATAPVAADALFILRAAVGSATCDERVCNVDAAEGITATDALLTLKKAVGHDVMLTCPT